MRHALTNTEFAMEFLEIMNSEFVHVHMLSIIGRSAEVISLSNNCMFNHTYNFPHDISKLIYLFIMTYFYINCNCLDNLTLRAMYIN